MIGQLTRHETARAALRLKVAFRRQLIVGGRHRRPRHAQQIGELARRRDAVPRAEARGQDAVPPLIVDLAVQRGARAAIEDDGNLHGATPAPGLSRGLGPGAWAPASGLYENTRSGACAQSTSRLPYEHAAGARRARPTGRSPPLRAPVAGRSFRIMQVALEPDTVSNNVTGTAFVVAEYRAEENYAVNPLYRDDVVGLFLSAASRRAAA